VERRRNRKQRWMQQHSRQRAWERYGIDLDKSLRRRIIQDIQNGRSTPIKTQSNRVTHHSIEVEGKRVRVVYDKRRKDIVTVLPQK